MEYTLSTERNFALAAKDAEAMLEVMRRGDKDLAAMIAATQARLVGHSAFEVVAGMFGDLGCELMTDRKAIIRVSYRKLGYSNPTAMLLRVFGLLAPFVPTGARLFLRASEGAKEGWSDERYIFDADELKRIKYDVVESW